ncbi:hypothetical protein FRB95_011945 [Tulasnella sp. JGI-2019a]|nr:hypothetical protein FRB95_011945 [Tulasnella sp. JGI-2019a]
MPSPTRIFSLLFLIILHFGRQRGRSASYGAYLDDGIGALKMTSRASKVTRAVHEEAAEIMTQATHVTSTSIVSERYCATTIDITNFNTASLITSTTTQVNTTPMSFAAASGVSTSNILAIIDSVLWQLLLSRSSRNGKELGIL